MAWLGMAGDPLASSLSWKRAPSNLLLAYPFVPLVTTSKVFVREATPLQGPWGVSVENGQKVDDDDDDEGDEDDDMFSRVN